MLLTNRGKPRDTWDAWEFYRKVRVQFGVWDHVDFTVVTDPHRPWDDTAQAKLVRFVDVDGNTLELYGVNFGYEGGTPAEVVKTLVQEGFSNRDVIAAVYNRSKREVYPRTIARSGAR